MEQSGMNTEEHNHGSNYGNPGNEGSPPRGSAPHAYRPYWKRAHQDWRFVLGMVLVFAAIAIYVMTDNLALVPRGQPPRKQPGTVGQ
jgi:hypothetical protein